MPQGTPETSWQDKGSVRALGWPALIWEQKVLHVPVASPHRRKQVQWLRGGSSLHKEGRIPELRLEICTIRKWSYSLGVINSSVLNPDASPISLAGDCHSRWCEVAKKLIQHEFVLPTFFRSNETTGRIAAGSSTEYQ